MCKSQNVDNCSSWFCQPSLQTEAWVLQNLMPRPWICLYSNEEPGMTMYYGNYAFTLYWQDRWPKPSIAHNIKNILTSIKSRDPKRWRVSPHWRDWFSARVIVVPKNSTWTSWIRNCQHATNGRWPRCAYLPQQRKAEGSQQSSTILCRLWGSLWQKVCDRVMLSHCLVLAQGLLTYVTRLWHQLTQRVLEFLKEPESGPHQISLFQKFVVDWESKINKLSLVFIGLTTARKFTGTASTLILHRQCKECFSCVHFRASGFRQLFVWYHHKGWYRGDERCICLCSDGNCIL